MEGRHDAQFRAPAEGTVTMRLVGFASFKRLLAVFLAALGLMSIALAAPANAHKGHKKAAAVEQVQHGNQEPQNASTGTSPQTAMHHGAAAEQTQTDMPMAGMDMGMDRSKMSFLERLFAWIGRLHPLIVHFPIAFFPAALFTAVVGRRRPAFSLPVQFLVVAGGVFAPLAAAAGWLAGMSADPDPLLPYHRWLGVGVGVVGLGLGIWAWRRPWEDRGAGMILALTLITIAIAVQGFLGAGLTHGMDHLMF